MPSRIGLMLDMTSRQLERVIYYEDYIVIDPGNTPLQKGQLLTEAEFREAEDQYGEDFEAGMGAEAIQKLLAQTDLPNLQQGARTAMGTTRSQADSARRSPSASSSSRASATRSRVRNGWCSKCCRSSRRILRPLVPLEGGRFATSDLERSLSSRHQPQQPSQEPAPAQDAGSHHPQRKADAAGGGGRARSTTAAMAVPSPAPAIVR